MSRSYEMGIMVSEYEPSKYDAIVDAVAALGFDADADPIGDQIVFSSEVINVAAGKCDESVARDIHRAVWKANRGFCVVNVTMRDCDIEVPVYTGTQARYDEWLA